MFVSRVHARFLICDVQICERVFSLCVFLLVVRDLVLNACVQNLGKERRIKN